MSEPTKARRPAELALRAGAYVIDGVLVGGGRLLLKAAGAPWLVPLGLAACYYTWMPVAYEGQTFGKMAAGVAIVDERGEPLTYGQCFGRYAGYFLSAALLGAGYVVAAFHPEGRALHDIVASTRVVAVAPVTRGRRLAVLAAAAVGLILLPLALGAALLLSAWKS